MSFATWLAFTAASSVLLIIPGPTILVVISYALGRGMRAAVPVAVGVALGDFTALTLSLLGLGALLATSTTLFVIFKWIGAAYLVWLGIALWRAGGRFEAEPGRERTAALNMLGHAWIVTALNPKSITFFVAFLPQFLDPARDFWHQMLIFEATFLGLAFANAIGYGLLAARARGLVQSEVAIGLFNRAGGSLLIGAGLAAAPSQEKAGQVRARGRRALWTLISTTSNASSKIVSIVSSLTPMAISASASATCKSRRATARRCGSNTPSLGCSASRSRKSMAVWGRA
jgi:threonine/homoserine/homoserine lactone efflux protein